MVTLVTKVVIIVRKLLGNCMFLTSLKKSEYFKHAHAHPVQNFTKILPTGAELLYADGLTDRRTVMTKVMVVFKKYWNVPKSRDLANVSVGNSKFVMHDV